MTARIPALDPPFAPELQAQFDALMRGRPPLVLFTTIARDARLWGKLTAGSLLDRGHLRLRQRELVIDRTTARCGAEYEWGVHVATFGAKVGLTEAQIRSLARGAPSDDCWSDDDRLLLEFCDAMHERCDVDDALWNALRAHFSEDAMLELLMLAGSYRMVSCLANALRLPAEPEARRFPA